MAWKTLDDMDLAGKRVLVRVDINVPVEGGRVTDTTRIDRIVPTIRDILDKGGKPILLAHFGRPKGKVVPEMSLRQFVPALEHAFGTKVVFADGNYGQTAAALTQGEVMLCENVRFNPGEEKNDEAFAQRLATLGEVYVNDAFSAAHRAHASTEGIAHLLPAAAGRAMERELNYLASALSNPVRPMMAVVGGAKVSTKIDLLLNLVSKANILVVGGGMANTFMFAKGQLVGKSLCEPSLADTAREIMAQAESRGCEIILPVDVVVAKKFEANAEHETRAADSVRESDMILDLGPDTVDLIAERMEGAKTLVWNGPLGAFEIPPFDTATVEAARYAAKRVNEGALVAVAGGGDTVAALNHAQAADDFTYVSTAGGAFLEWLEGKELPGVKALETE